MAGTSQCLWSLPRSRHLARQSLLSAAAPPSLDPSLASACSGLAAALDLPCPLLTTLAAPSPPAVTPAPADLARQLAQLVPLLRLQRLLGDACPALEEAESLLDASAAPIEELACVYVAALEKVVVKGEGKNVERLRAAEIVPPRVLIVAGSDSGGGAGLQADLKTCAVLGAFGTTAVAALTAQNSEGVQAVFPIPLDFVKKQMESVLGDIGTDVVKTGMLATAEIVAEVASALRAAGELEAFRRCLVVDPVMVSTSGHVLLEKDAVECVKSKLLPLATVITPNLPEAELLLGKEIHSLEEMEAAARELCALGPRWSLLKGGHMEGEDVATDILCNGATGHCQRFTARMVPTRHTHGTGCTLASAVAALLAKGHSVPEAVEKAKGFVSGAIEASAHLALGKGPQGPMNHSWELAEW